MKTVLARHNDNGNSTALAVINSTGIRVGFITRWRGKLRFRPDHGVQLTKLELAEIIELMDE